MVNLLLLNFLYEKLFSLSVLKMFSHCLLSSTFAVWKLVVFICCSLLPVLLGFVFSVLFVEQFHDDIASCRFISILFGTCGAF